MKKGQIMAVEQKKKISDSVKIQHKEGRTRVVPFTDEARRKAVTRTWKGQLASRVAKHRWVAYWKGRPQQCEVCGTDKKRKYEWANKDHKYKRILEDYIRMCTSCHRNYDIEHNNYRK